MVLSIVEDKEVHQWMESPWKAIFLIFRYTMDLFFLCSLFVLSSNDHITSSYHPQFQIFSWKSLQLLSKLTYHTSIYLPIFLLQEIWKRVQQVPAYLLYAWSLYSNGEWFTRSHMNKWLIPDSLSWESRINIKI